MIKIESGVELVKTGKNAAARVEIETALKGMAVGDGFPIEDNIKAGTVRSVAKALKIKIKIGFNAEGEKWCKKI